MIRRNAKPKDTPKDTVLVKHFNQIINYRVLMTTSKLINKSKAEINQNFQGSPFQGMK
jgi:hypothetical protein